jgi:YfiR/HmsC-like
MPIARAVEAQPVAAPVTDAMPVPASLQLPLLLKILTYDRNFAARTGSSLRIAVVFSGASPESIRARDEIAAAFEAFADKTVKNLPIRYSALEYVSDSQVDGAARADQINVFYFTPGISAHLDGLLRISRTNQIITTTGVPEYVEKGVAVGIGIKLDKPHILINLGTSKAVGTEFDVSLLRIARVIR